MMYAQDASDSEIEETRNIVKLRIEKEMPPAISAATKQGIKMAMANELACELIEIDAVEWSEEAYHNHQRDRMRGEMVFVRENVVKRNRTLSREVRRLTNGKRNLRKDNRRLAEENRALRDQKEALEQLVHEIFDRDFYVDEDTMLEMDEDGLTDILNGDNTD